MMRVLCDLRKLHGLGLSSAVLMIQSSMIFLIVALMFTGAHAAVGLDDVTPLSRMVYPRLLEVQKGSTESGGGAVLVAQGTPTYFVAGEVYDPFWRIYPDQGEGRALLLVDELNGALQFACYEQKKVVWSVLLNERGMTCEYMGEPRTLAFDMQGPLVDCYHNDAYVGSLKTNDRQQKMCMHKVDDDQICRAILQYMCGGVFLKISPIFCNDNVDLSVDFWQKSKRVERFLLGDAKKMPFKDMAPQLSCLLCMDGGIAHSPPAGAVAPLALQPVAPLLPLESDRRDDFQQPSPVSVPPILGMGGLASPSNCVPPLIGEKGMDHAFRTRKISLRSLGMDIEYRDGLLTLQDEWLMKVCCNDATTCLLVMRLREDGALFALEYVQYNLRMVCAYFPGLSGGQVCASCNEYEFKFQLSHGSLSIVPKGVGALTTIFENLRGEKTEKNASIADLARLCQKPSVRKNLPFITCNYSGMPIALVQKEVLSITIPQGVDYFEPISMDLCMGTIPGGLTVGAHLVNQSQRCALECIRIKTDNVPVLKPGQFIHLEKYVRYDLGAFSLRVLKRMDEKKNIWDWMIVEEDVSRVEGTLHVAGFGLKSWIFTNNTNGWEYQWAWMFTSPPRTLLYVSGYLGKQKITWVNGKSNSCVLFYLSPTSQPTEKHAVSFDCVLRGSSLQWTLHYGRQNYWVISKKKETPSHFAAFWNGAELVAQMLYQDMMLDQLIFAPIDKDTKFKGASDVPPYCVTAFHRGLCNFWIHAMVK